MAVPPGKVLTAVGWGKLWASGPYPAVLQEVRCAACYSQEVLAAEACRHRCLTHAGSLRLALPTVPGTCYSKARQPPHLPADRAEAAVGKMVQAAHAQRALGAQLDDLRR